MVASMVIIGGITRLTNSGLSIVEWKLIMGAMPPSSDSEWQETFSKYQQFPEYQQINKDYTLADFKSIFWWEYMHRLIGRLIGVVFLIPFVIFWIKGYFDRSWLVKLIVLFALGGLQGFLGWFMVKSGLIDIPDVSHYRLAIHLIAAFLLFSYIIWLIIGLISPDKSDIKVIGYKPILWLFFIITLAQITYGAFVAGLDAGKFYPTFPTMNGEWMPVIIAKQFAEAGWVSLISDVPSVQFIHRILGYTLFILISMIYFAYYPSLREKGKKGLKALYALISIQALLGISVVLLSVPILLAVLHQITALIILGLIIINIHGARVGNSERA
jgi:cytochrome c oxidase assembly protein subunit 15